jgi:hypothetical protein
MSTPNNHSAAAYDAAQPDPRKPGRPPINGETAKGHVHIRATLARKSAWVRAAKPQSLAHWATENLDRAANYKAENEV